MKHDNAWQSALERGEVSLDEAMVGDACGMAPPVEDEVPSYAAMAFAVDCEVALEGGRTCPSLIRADGLSQGEHDRLLASGVPQDFLANLNIAGDLGTARVSLACRGSRFELGGPDGRLLLGVRDARFQLVDLVALASHNENEWSLLHGFGDMLGAWWIEEMHRRMCTERPARLRLFATPWDWLRGGGHGVCVLEWTAGVIGELRLLGERCTLVTGSTAQKRDVAAKLARGGLPIVSEEVKHAPASLAERIGMGAI